MKTLKEIQKFAKKHKACASQLNMFEKFLKEGEQLGVWTWWHENGKKDSKGNYKEGEQLGVWTWWHENGKKIKTKNYK